MLDASELAPLFLPSTPPLEIIVRGTVTYLALFTLLRVVLKRQSSSVGITDLLVVVLIADAAQNAMADDYTSIVDGLLLVTTIVAWSYGLDRLGFRFPRTVGRYVHPPPLPLVEDGRVLPANLRRELITREELMTQLRLQGIEDIAQVRRAAIEGNGEFSVIKSDGGRTERRRREGIR